MKMLSLALAGAAIPLANTGALSAQTESFVTVSGPDTVAIETFARVGNVITGDWITRQGAVVHHYVLTLGAGGVPVKYDLDLHRLTGRPMSPFLTRVTVTYGADTASVVTVGDSTDTRRAALRNAYPIVGSSVAGVEAALAALRATHADSGSITIHFPTQRALPPFGFAVRSLGSDSGGVFAPQGRRVATVDRDGHVAEFGSGLGETHRVPTLDVAHFRKVFAAADSAAQSKASGRGR